MREMTVTEQRYKAILGVIADGRMVSEVARDWGVSRRTIHRWPARYEGEDSKVSGIVSSAGPWDGGNTPTMHAAAPHVQPRKQLPLLWD